MKRLVRTIEDTSEPRFWIIAGTFFAILVALNYSPAFGGPIPLPGHLATQFPAWNEVRGDAAVQPVANIGDLITYFYPFNAFSAAGIANGILPLWNKHLMSGVPFQAEPQTALFYPLHVLYYAFSTPTAWTLSLMVRMWLSAMFMALLVKSMGVSRTGSIVAGMVFAFSGFMVAWQGAVMVDTAMWLPLLCYAVLRLRRRLSGSSVVLLALGFAMSILAGHPETTLHVGLTTVAWAVFLWAFPPDGTCRFDMQFLALFGIAGVLAVWLASIQLLPTLEWVREGSRHLHHTWPSFPVGQMLGFFSRDILQNPNSVGVLVPNAVGYVGMGTLVLAALGTLHASRAWVAWWIGLILFAAAATYGFPPVYWLLTHTPIVQGLKNERLIFIMGLCLAALAGKGVQVLDDPKARFTENRVLAWALAGLSFAAALYGVSQLMVAKGIEVDTIRGSSASLALLLAGFALVAWKLIRGQRAQWVPVVVVVLLAVDLVTFAHGYTGHTRRGDVYPSNPVIDFLRAQGHPDEFRVARAGGAAYSSNTLIMYGLQTVEGFENAVPKRLGRLTADFTVPHPVEVSLRPDKTLASADRRLDLLNVKYLVVVTSAPERVRLEELPRFRRVFEQGEVAVYENLSVLPRAFLVPASGIETIPDASAQIKRLRNRSFDPQQNVVVDQTPPGLMGLTGLTGLAPSSAEFHGDVETTHSDANGYRFRVRSSAPAVLVVSQNLYPGWTASTAEGPLDVFHANHALTGILVPAGNHSLDLVFEPASFERGMVLSIAGAACIAVLLVFRVTPAHFRRTWALTMILAVGAGIPAFAFISLERVDDALPLSVPPEPPELSLSQSEDTAGRDSVVFRIPQLPNASVSVRYTIDGGAPAEFATFLDSEGEVLFEVGIAMPKGDYRFLAFQETGARDWIPSNVRLIVK